MRYLTIILLLASGISYAQSAENKRLLFEFDEVIHYKYDLENILPSWQAKSRLFKSQKKENLRQLLYANTPKTLSDSNALFSSLDKSTFIKNTIDSDKLDSLRLAFSVRDTNVVRLPSRCSVIYRDIVVLKKNGKIICITKLCMKCSHSYFLGDPDLDTKFFGQHGEWGILKKVLSYEREPTLWEIYGDQEK